jgi:hypothetical protein
VASVFTLSKSASRVSGLFRMVNLTFMATLLG